MTDWTGTYIITLKILFLVLKGIDIGSQTSFKTTQRGVATPSTLPLDQPLKRGSRLGEASRKVK